MKDEIKEILDELDWYIKQPNEQDINGEYEPPMELSQEEAKEIYDCITNLQEENKRLEKINGVALTYNKHLMLCERQRHNLQHLKQMESILKGEGLE